MTPQAGEPPVSEGYNLLMDGVISEGFRPSTVMTPPPIKTVMFTIEGDVLERRWMEEDNRDWILVLSDNESWNMKQSFSH